MFGAWLVAFGRIVAAVVLNTASGVQAQQTGSGSGSGSASSVVNPLAGGSLIGSVSFDFSGAITSLTFNADGTISGTYYAGQTFDDIWFDGTPDQTYELKATVVSESGSGTKSGTFGTWGTFPQTYSVSRVTGTGTKTATINFQIRRQSDTAVVSNGSNNYELSASRDVIEE